MLNVVKYFLKVTEKIFLHEQVSRTAIFLQYLAKIADSIHSFIVQYGYSSDLKLVIEERGLNKPQKYTT